MPGLVAGLQRSGPTHEAIRVGMLWLDAHGDINTPETTPSGNVHGMPLAALCGYGHPDLISIGGWRDTRPAVDPANVVVVGARDLDPLEAELMRHLSWRLLREGEQAPVAAMQGGEEYRKLRGG